MKIITVFLLAIFLPHCVRSRNSTVQCNWLSEYLCGDTCIGLPATCFCGEDILAYSDSKNYSCCNTGPCSSANQALGAQCEGQKQHYLDTCHGSCPQTSYGGYITSPCDHAIHGQPECYLQTRACRGVSLCEDKSDLQHCSEPKDCTKNSQHTNCGQVKDAKFENYGCKYIYGETVDYFECTNRMDKAHSLFARSSIVPTKNLVGDNFNELLLFDDDFIYCGHRNFSYEDFFDLQLAHPNELCQLEYNHSITLNRLWQRLIVDFPFKMSRRIEELYGGDRINQMAFNCLDFQQPFICDKGQEPNWCTTDQRVCDGIANCPLAEDENFTLRLVCSTL